jgi:hypothetical protein
MKDYKDIIKKYPLLFPQEEDSQEPISLFSFECDIGWYDIIEKACATMYSRYRSTKNSVNYWKERLENKEKFLEQTRQYEKGKTDEEIIEDRQKFLNDLMDKMEVMEAELPKIAQIKEKFSTLRFYLDVGKESDYDIASYAESMSEVTCEKCGNVGTTYTIGWHKTLCKEHAIERYGEEKVENYLMQLNKKN